MTVNELQFRCHTYIMGSMPKPSMYQFYVMDIDCFGTEPTTSLLVLVYNCTVAYTVLRKKDPFFWHRVYIQLLHDNKYLNSKPFSNVPRFRLWYCSLARKTSTVSPCLSTCSGTVISWLLFCSVDDDKGRMHDQVSGRTNPCTNKSLSHKTWLHSKQQTSRIKSFKILQI